MESTIYKFFEQLIDRTLAKLAQMPDFLSLAKIPITLTHGTRKCHSQIVQSQAESPSWTLKKKTILGILRHNHFRPVVSKAQKLLFWAWFWRLKSQHSIFWSQSWTKRVELHQTTSDSFPIFKLNLGILNTHYFGIRRFRTVQLVKSNLSVESTPSRYLGKISIIHYSG